jgi:hypothetical protein
MIAVHNFSVNPQQVEFTVPDTVPEGSPLVDLLRDGQIDPDERGRVSLALDAFDYRWLRVHPSDDKRLA